MLHYKKEKTETLDLKRGGILFYNLQFTASNLIVRQVVVNGPALAGYGVYNEEGLYIKFLNLPMASSYHEGGVI